jgi:hypothetical protein
VTGINRTPLVLGDILQDSRRVLAQRGLGLFLLAFLLVYPAGAASAWLRHHSVFQGDGFFVHFSNGSLDWLLLTVPLSAFLGATIWTTAQTLDAQAFSWSQAVKMGARFALPLLVVQVLYILGILAGMILLVIPGLIVTLAWTFVTQSLVIDRVGIVEAFQRSRATTKGHRWALLGLTILYFVVVIGLEWTLFRLTAGGKTFVQAADTPINAYGFAPLLNTVVTPLATVFMTALYMRLRPDRRGSADLTAEVFA